MDRKPHYRKEGIRHATINGHRFHLRLTDPGEDNFLWIDGRSPPLLLDQVAAEFAGHLIDAMWEHQQGQGDESEKVRAQVIEKMFKRYGSLLGIGRRRVTRARLCRDLDRIFGILMKAAEGGCPVEAGLEGKEILPERWAAPARMDMAVTYRCNLDCAHCYTGGPRKMEELSTEQWLRVLEVLWRIGIPQVVFTGGEPLLREDLIRLVSEADEFVTGLVTNGCLLEEKAEALKNASLDYLQITLESHDPAVHNAMVGAGAEDAHAKTLAGIRKTLDLEMQVVTNTTLIRENAERFEDLIHFGKELGLKNMACNALICSGRGRAAKRKDTLTLDALKAVLGKAATTARDLGINLQWYTPTCYHELNPLELGFGPKSCSAAVHNMTVQPDGGVLPCQSWPETVGHILEDPWADIWNHPACKKLRDYGYGKEREECAACEDLPLCGGGCPLEDDGRWEDKA